MMTSQRALAFAALIIMGCSSREADGMPDDAGIVPLRTWMKANASPALQAGRFDKLETVFHRLETTAPTDDAFKGWPAVADQGARAAARNDIEGVREACKQCHEQYRATYKSRMTESNR